MKPKRKAGYESTFHRDGTVSYWDIYAQNWRRQSAASIRDEVLRSFDSEEVDRVRKHAETCPFVGEGE